jgi:hypothetical protein
MMPIGSNKVIAFLVRIRRPLSGKDLLERSFSRVNSLNGFGHSSLAFLSFSTPFRTGHFSHSGLLGKPTGVPVIKFVLRGHSSTFFDQIPAGRI